MKNFHVDVDYTEHGFKMPNAVDFYTDRCWFGKRLSITVHDLKMDVEDEESGLVGPDTGVTVYDEILESEIVTANILPQHLRKMEGDYYIKARLYNQDDHLVEAESPIHIIRSTELDMPGITEERKLKSLRRLHTMMAPLDLLMGTGDYKIMETYIAGHFLQIEYAGGLCTATLRDELGMSVGNIKALTVSDLMAKVMASEDFGRVLDSGKLFERFMHPVKFTEDESIRTRLRLKDEFIYRTVDNVYGTQQRKSHPVVGAIRGVSLKKPRVKVSVEKPLTKEIFDTFYKRFLSESKCDIQTKTGRAFMSCMFGTEFRRLLRSLGKHESVTSQRFGLYFQYNGETWVVSPDLKTKEYLSDVH
ncbi:hypothetical protein [Vibrio phage pTD1]|uniref:Uncharacterized protein n=1 Tax=Vibrio phage pTD1 TaxID=1938577 RepID=A0A1Q2U2N0_9CAUD|nr:hypothetical protein FDH33_gp007 [Vibrio phage pTD1]BAW98216.1 hypothetical protein [Vibrio phage pTD1]